MVGHRTEVGQAPGAGKGGRGPGKAGFLSGPLVAAGVVLPVLRDRSRCSGGSASHQSGYWHLLKIGLG